MEGPAFSPSPAAAYSEADISPQSTAPVTWIGFGGFPNESSADFIRSVQRVAFQHNKLRDDRWMTDYASTCFNGEALGWFLDLDENTQESWKQLRKALYRRFPPPPTPVPTNPHPSSLVSGVPSPVPSVSTLLATNASIRRGHLEVVGKLRQSFGFLSFDQSSGIGITQSENQAVIVTLPDPISSQPCHIQMIGLPAPVAAFPFLGIVLDNSHLPQPSDSIPDSIKMYLRPGCYWDVPVFSEMCGRLLVRGPFDGKNPPLATWKFLNCGKSRLSLALLRKSETALPKRATAAIWKYDGNGEDLRITCLMDDQRECELGVYIRGSRDGLHLHRRSDGESIDRCENFLDEVPVTLVFKGL